MTLEEAVEYFGSRAQLARTLKINAAAVTNWAARGDRIPELQQMKLERITHGALKADTEEE